MYFVIYDVNDNVVAYCDSLEELLNFTKVRKNNLLSRINLGKCYHYLVGNTYNKIYAFR